MGFESAIPPLPRREDEIYAIQKLQESWLNQPYHKYYMNEDVRRPKMQFADRQNKVRAEFWTNFFVIGALSIPLAMLARRFVVSRVGNIPRTYPLSDYTWKQRTSFETRVKAYNHLATAIWSVNTFFWSFVLTNWEPIEDQNYSFVSKVKKMI